MAPTMAIAAKSTTSVLTSQLIDDFHQNATDCPKDFPPLESAWLYSMALITFVGFVITLSSNGIIFYLFWSTPSLRNNPSNIIAFNLSLSDLLLSTQWPSVIYCCLTHSKGILQYESVCQTFGFISTVTGFASILTVLAMSIERAVVIRSSLLAKSRITMRIAGVTTLFIWAGALLANLPPILGYVAKYRIDPSNTGCFLDYLMLDNHEKSTTNAYIFTLTLCFFIMPAIIIFICYMVILNAFKRSSDRLQRIDCELQSSVNSTSDRTANDREQTRPNVANRYGDEDCDSPGNHSSASSQSRGKFHYHLGNSLRHKMSMRLRRHQQQHRANLSISDQLNQELINQRRSSDTIVATNSAPTSTSSSIYNIEKDDRFGQDRQPGPSMISNQPKAERIPIEQRRLAFRRLLTQSAIASCSLSMGGEASNNDTATTIRQKQTDCITIAEKRYQKQQKSTYAPIQMRLIPCRADDEQQLTPKSLGLVERQSGAISSASGFSFKFKPKSNNNDDGPDSPAGSFASHKPWRRDLNCPHSCGSRLKQSSPATLLRVSMERKHVATSGDQNAIANGLDEQNQRENPSIIMKPANAAGVHQAFSRTDLQIRLAIMSFYLILLWLISWAPIALLSMINSLDMRCEKFSSLSIFLASTMTKVGPTFDVFIYGISHPKIKVRYRQIIKRLILAGPLACQTVYLIVASSIQKLVNSLTESDTTSESHNG